ncbi:hypothetical protein [Amycolatopsis sp. A133]|uniref:hypothetical protein n=1 Tax=Amycolatopsis sp. A133 TaxID=3064472 RepID=UPI0037C0A725
MFYRWKRRYEDDGLDGLKDRSSAPLHRPTRWSRSRLPASPDRQRHGVPVRQAPGMGGLLQLPPPPRRPGRPDPDQKQQHT